MKSAEAPRHRGTHLNDAGAEMKHCSPYGHCAPLDEFYRRGDGRQNQCKWHNNGYSPRNANPLEFDDEFRTRAVAAQNGDCWGKVQGLRPGEDHTLVNGVGECHHVHDGQRPSRDNFKGMTCRGCNSKERINDNEYMASTEDCVLWIG